LFIKQTILFFTQFQKGPVPRLVRPLTDTPGSSRYGR